MLTLLQLLLLAYCNILVAAAQTYVGDFSGTILYNSHGPYNFTGNGSNTAELQLKLDKTNSVNQVLMIVKTSYLPPSFTEIYFDTYQHKLFNNSSAYDLQHANAGQTQIVNVGGLSAGNKLYIFVINFNRQINPSYTINVTQRLGYNSGYCKPIGNPTALNSIYCATCVSNLFIGAFCDISHAVLSENKTETLILEGSNDKNGNFGTFTIPTSKEIINLLYTANNTNVIVSIQLKQSNLEVAGIMNFGLKNLINITLSNNQQNILYDSFGKYDVSVSFLNLNPTPVNISVTYQLQAQESFNILGIVLGIIGATLFLMLFVVLFCIYRNCWQNSEFPINHGLPMQQSQMRVQNGGSLTPYEIQSYFPSVQSRQVLNEEQLSTYSLTNEKLKGEERECGICLCPIASSEMIKITYCRHIFHGNCLNNWFEKQRKCPYCRQEYNKATTSQHYRKLLYRVRKVQLAGIDLVRQIWHSKPTNSAILLESVKE